MAAAAPLQGLYEEATCSICLEYFQDPVTAECGHNFCRACLAKCWESCEGEEISCPQCRRKIQRKPIRNRQLGNFVDLTRQLRLQEEKSLEGKGGVCGKHQEPLKLFCKNDDAPICVVCNKAKEHRDHQVVPLEEAAQHYQCQIHHCLEFLESERANMLVYKAETKLESKELLKRTQAEMVKMKEQFRELHSFVNEKERLLQVELEEVEKETAKKRNENLAGISNKLSSLDGLIQEVEEKCKQPPGELLQDIRSFLQRRKKKETFQNLIAFPSELNVKISEVCDRNTSLVRLMNQFKDNLYFLPLHQKANVTLDPDTANPYLILSQDRKSVNHGDKFQDLPDNLERFNVCSYVLGCEGFTGGRHCWDVTQEKEGDWAIGVARKSIRRKGFVKVNTKEGIWAIRKNTLMGDRSEYWAFSNRSDRFFPLSDNLRKIRVSLNCEKGEVDFHDGDTGSQLYSFSGVSFSGETLLPFFCLCGKASLTISP